MPSRQNDKLKKLLGITAKKVPDMVRAREMNDVRNYNRNQQAKVFENEKRQVARYADTNAPQSAKDIGSAFKLQVYTLKINGLLQAKQDSIRQIELVIGTANAGQVTLGASQLRDARLAPYLNTTFGKSEIIQTFNEMMAFIKTYMGDIFSNDRVRDNAYTSFLTPLSNAFIACANEYPDFYSSLGVRGGQAGANDLTAKAIFRQQAIQVFSLLMTCAENINIQALRPITASDIDSYSTKNEVDDIIANRGRAVVPGPAPLPPAPSILPDRPDEPPPPQVDPRDPRFDDPNVPPAPQQPPQQPPQQGQPIQRADLNSTVQALLAFEQANPAGVQDPLRRTAYRADPNVNDGGKGFRQAFRAWNDLGVGQGNQFPPPTAQLLAEGLRQLGQQRRGQPAPAPQQGQQGGPAPVDPRTEANFDGFETNNIVLNALGVRTGTQVGDATETIINNVRGVENDQGRVMNAKNDADVQAVYDLLDTRVRQAYEAEYPTEAQKKDRIREVIRAMRNARIAFVQRKNLPATSERQLYGMGMSGGEFHEEDRRQPARHREPFDNFFDERGYRQGAVHRMTTMFVPEYEVRGCGFNRLKGGDQLADHDPELLRRQDHHDVSLYRPVVTQQPIHGYGHDGDEDTQYEGGLKQRLRKPIATDVIARPYHKDPMLVHRVEDHDEFQPKDIFNGLAHYSELEKPADMDEDPNPFRVRTENHKVNTGKMKKVTYHTK